MWKNNWIEAQNNLIKWWHGEGLAIHLCAERQSRNAALIKPVDPANWEMLWTDPLYRLPQAEFEMAHTDYLAEAFPYFDTQIGPGSLGTFIGSSQILPQIPSGMKPVSPIRKVTGPLCSISIITAGGRFTWH